MAMTAPHQPVMTLHREYVIEYLQSEDNFIEDTKGRCSQMVAAATGINPSSITNILLDMERHDMITRRIRQGGKRTYRISLTPEYLDYDTAHIRDIRSREDEGMATVVDIRDEVDDDSTCESCGRGSNDAFVEAALAVLDEVMVRRTEQEGWLPSADVEQLIEEAVEPYRKIKTELKAANEDLLKRLSGESNRANNSQMLVQEKNQKIELLEDEITDLKRKIREGIQGPRIRDRIKDESVEALDRFMRRPPTDRDR